MPRILNYVASAAVFRAERDLVRAAFLLARSTINGRGMRLATTPFIFGSRTIAAVPRSANSAALKLPSVSSGPIRTTNIDASLRTTLGRARPVIASTTTRTDYQRRAVRALALSGLCLALAACSARSPYLETPEKPVNLNTAISAVSLDVYADGRCVFTALFKNGKTTQTEQPRAVCADATVIKAALATVPKPAPAAPAGKP